MRSTFCSTIIATITLLSLNSCEKSEIAKNEITEETNAQVFLKSVAETQLTARQTPPEISELIRKYNEWVFTREFSVNPFDDVTGEKQYAAQPFSNGTMFLASGMGPDLQTRSVTIKYSQYQKIFIGILALTSWVNDCPPNSYLPNNKYPFGLFNSSTSGGFNVHNSSVLLKWNSISILPQQVADLRGNSGTWSFVVDPSWPAGCENPSLAYADGLFTTVPLSLGTHQLEIFGSAYYPIFKFNFSNHVLYNITVVP